MTVFDVGANCGEWTSLALSVNPRLLVHCFEPSGAAYRRLVSRGFQSSVVCNSSGLRSRAGQGKLLIFDQGAGVNSLYRRVGLGRVQTQEETIRLDTVDEYSLAAESATSTS